MQIRRAIAGNLLTGSLGRIVNALTPILLVPFMIRTWGLEIYGEWLILTAIPSYIMLSPDFGLAGAVINRMAYLTAKGNEQDAIYIYRTTFFVLLMAGGFFVGLGWLIAWWVDWSYVGVSTLKPSASAAIIGWSCIRIFIAQLSNLLTGIYRSARLNPRLGLLVSISQIFYLSVSLTVLWLNYTPTYYIFFISIAYALFFVVLLIDSRRIMPNFTLSHHGISLQCVRPYIIPGLGYAGMPLIHALQNQGVLIVLGSILGPASVAIFQTARILSNGTKSILGLLTSAIMVELPALLGENRKELVERLLIRNTQVGTLLTICAIITISLAGEAIYRMWLGDNVPYLSMMVLVLLFSLFPFVIGQSFTILLFAKNQIHFAVLPLVIVAIGSIGCVSFFSFFAHLPGAAVGIFIWEAGSTAVVFRIISNNNTLKVRRYYKECFKLKLLLKDIRLAFRLV